VSLYGVDPALEEREERLWAGMEDHWDDDARPTEPPGPKPIDREPYEPPIEGLCQRKALGRWNGERRCLGPLVDGVCTRCRRLKGTQP
jgi:hypothetical protein